MAATSRAATLALIKPCVTLHPARLARVLHAVRALRAPPVADNAAQTLTSAARAAFAASAFSALAASGSSLLGTAMATSDSTESSRSTQGNMCVAAATWFPQLPPGMAAAFYVEHSKRFFYGRLVSFMGSGPVLALALAAPPGHDAIGSWRALLGATKVARTRLEQPYTLRGAYGLSDTRNLGHGSDAPATAARELELFFPALYASGELAQRVASVGSAALPAGAAVLDTVMGTADVEHGTAAAALQYSLGTAGFALQGIDTARPS